MDIELMWTFAFGICIGLIFASIGRAVIWTIAKGLLKWVNTIIEEERIECE